MSNDNMADEEIVSFPVPKRYLPVVIRALAHAMEEGEVPLPPASPEVISVTQKGDGNRGWTKERIAKLKSLVQNQTVRMLLNTAATKPEQWIGFRELMILAGRTYGEARSDLAAFTQLIRRNFEQDAWPIQVEWSDNEAQVHYLMSHDVADWWSAV